MSDNKKTYGQYYTSHYKHILQNMIIPDVKTIIEPFAGNGDLLNFVENKDIKIHCFDIDPKKENIKEQDTLLNPVDYKDTFVLTNPPYLARNKNRNKTIYNLYNENDLYKCFIRTLIDNPPIGGIIIIPLNFLSSIRKSDSKLRYDFMCIFHISLVNIFEERVFDDTSYTICSMQFIKREPANDFVIDAMIYPSKKNITLHFNERNNYTIGGDIYLLPNSTYTVERLTRLNTGHVGITNILVKCIDNDSKNKICLAFERKKYSDDSKKLSARSYATLVINPPLSEEKQLILIDKFNKLLNDYREQYNSLFLSNYRESNTIARKRISFGLVYIMVSFCLNQV